MSLPPAKPPKPKNVKLIRADFAYVAKEEDELSFEQGELLYILDSSKYILYNTYVIFVSSIQAQVNKIRTCKDSIIEI